MNGEKKGAARSQQAAPASSFFPMENNDKNIIARRARKTSAITRAQRHEIGVLRCTLVCIFLAFVGLLCVANSWQCEADRLEQENRELKSRIVTLETMGGGRDGNALLQG